MRKITEHIMGTSLRFFWAGLLALGMSTAFAETAPAAQRTDTTTPAKSDTTPQVVFQTTLGDLKIALSPEKAPVTVENFLHYVDSGFYNGVIFHRVVPGFVVQGGGFDQEYQRKPTQAPIANESNNGLQNLRGTLSMARTGDPNSATAQFFINLKDNPQLDGRPGQPGYAVFGRLIEGLEVIDAMAEQPQGNHTGVFMDAPNTAVVIERAYRYHPENVGKEASAPAEPQAPKAGSTPATSN
jgi:cyclophilin family peptidyl-prolyl cis-trans isomerase